MDYSRRVRTLADRYDARANGIGALRLALAFAVLAGHAWPLALGEPMPGFLWSGRQADVGKLAVYGFFVLSGFLITGSAVRFSTGRFLWHRALRIFPGLWVCLLVTAFVIAPAIALHEWGTLDGFWTHPYGPVHYVRSNWLLTMESWTVSGILADVPFGAPAGGSINGSLWSLRYEVLCYLLLAGIAATGALRRAPGVVVLLAAAAYWVIVEDFVRGAGLLVLPPKHGLLGPYPVAGIFDLQQVIYLTFVFLLGALARLYADRLPMTGPLAVFAAMVLVTTLHLGGFFVAGQLALGYLMLYAAVALPSWLHGVGRARDYSYGVYIYAFPVEQALASAIGLRFGFAGYLALTVAATVALAALSWHLVERPAMSLKDWTAKSSQLNTA